MKGMTQAEYLLRVDGAVHESNFDAPKGVCKLLKDLYTENNENYPQVKGYSWSCPRMTEAGYVCKECKADPKPDWCCQDDKSS